jgi:hypothetical protein
MPLVDTESDHKVDYICAECGYGVAVATPPPVCPMCHGSEWDRPLWSPYTSLDEYRTRSELPESEPLGSTTALAV